MSCLRRYSAKPRSSYSFLPQSPLLSQAAVTAEGSDGVEQAITARTASRIAAPVAVFEVVLPDVQAVRDLLQLAEREQHPLFAFIHLLVHTGMRRGEALALRWSNVNLEEGWLQVVEHVTRRHHQGVILDTPKTTAGVRIIDLDKLTVKVLRRHQDAQVQAGDSELVFPHGDGGFMKEAGVMRDLKELGQRVGVPGITWHQLRHLHASVALQNKQNVATVSRRLGHSKTSITLDTYSHMLPGWQQEVADAVAGAIADDPDEGPPPCRKETASPEQEQTAAAATPSAVRR